MNMMITPSIGTRFLMHGREFEIQVVAGRSVRYAAVKGGNSFVFELSIFEQYIRENRISVSQYVQDLIFHPDNCKEILRRRAYVEAAIKTLVHLSKRDDLEIVIGEVKTRLNDDQPPSTSSLIRWIKAYEKKEVKGLAIVKSGNVSLRFSPLIYECFWEGVQQVFLKPEHRQAEDVRDYLIGKLGSLGLADDHNCVLEVPSLRTIQRWIKQLDPILVIHAQKGKEAAIRAARASGCKFLSPGALVIVQIDTHYMNVKIVDPDTYEYLGRPYLVLLTCVRTRKIVGIHISLYPPSATTTLAAFKDMVVTHGIPSIIFNDRGVEFINFAMEHVCDELNVIIQTAPPRTPNMRAHIESLFSTMVKALYNKLEGTTFSNPTQRGQYDSEGKAIFTLAQVESYTREWIDEIYHQDEHTQTELTPNFMWERETQVMPPQKMTAEEIDVIARTPRWRTVHGGRILLNKIFYYSHALMLLNKRKVKVLFDELNLHFLVVEHPDEEGIQIRADSTDPEYTQGLTLNQHIEARKELKALSKKERLRLGIYATAFSRYRLLSRINEDASIAKKWLAKIKNGRSKDDMHSQTKQPNQPDDSVIQGEYSVVENDQSSPPPIEECVTTETPDNKHPASESSVPSQANNTNSFESFTLTGKK